MTDKTFAANHFVHDQQSQITALASIGLNAFKPIIQFQASMLRLWADNMDRLAGNCEKGLEKTATAMEEQSNKERAA
jgi:hypothetical protein